MLPLLAAVALAADPSPVAPAAWPFDELLLTNGGRFRGLLLADAPAGVRFQVVRRTPGRPTVTLTLFFPRDEVAAIKRLPPADRAALKDKLDALDPHGVGERQRMDELDLTRADWPGRPGAARGYRSDQFTLVSTAPDEVTRRAAVRLEQIYTAFARLLPPRVENAPPTTVFLAGTPGEYRALAGGALNPAVYDPARRRIICGTDLRRIGDDLAARRLQHMQQLAGVDRYEAEVRAAYKGQKAELDRFLEAAARERRRVWAAERANDRTFDAATARLFALLYHEAFHSYVGTWVYPPRPAAEVAAGKGTGELPRWLNEGLAQLFEGAVVEAGELRVDHPDPDRLVRVQGLLKGPPGLVPTAELLRAGAGSFLAEHAGQKAAADRAYLSAWAVAYFLAFGRPVVGTPKFDGYLSAVNAGGDPVTTFERLIGTDLPTFDVELSAYFARLAPDGSLRPKP